MIYGSEKYFSFPKKMLYFAVISKIQSSIINQKSSIINQK